MKLINCGCGAKYYISDEWENIDFNSHSHFVKKVNLLKGLPYQDESVDLVFSSCLLEHFDLNQTSFFLDEIFRCLKKDGIVRIVVPDLENICKEYLKQLENVKRDDTEENQLKYEYILIELIDQMSRKVSGGEMLRYWEREKRDDDYISERTGIPEIENNLTSRENFTLILKRKICGFINKCFSNMKLFQMFKQGRFQMSGEVHRWMYDSYNLGKELEKHGFVDVKYMKYNESNCHDWKEYGLEVNEDGTEYKPNSLYIEARKK